MPANSEPNVSTLFDPHEPAVPDHAQLTPSQPATDNHLQQRPKPSAVPSLAIVEPPRFLLAIAVQMERSAFRVRPLQCPLQQRLEVLQPVDVNPTLDVSRKVIDGLMQVGPLQVLVGTRASV